MKKYEDITVEQMLKIKELEKSDDIETTIEILSILYDKDITDLPINEVQKLIKSVDLTKKEKVVEKHYTINNKKYDVDLNMNITTAQYIDYTNYMKNNDIIKLISVFLIPEGHTYNDGYSLIEVMEDIKKMKWIDAEAIGFFFLKRFIVFTKIFRNCLNKKLKKMKDKTLKKQHQILIQIIDNFNNSVSFPTSLHTVN